jgi:8-oxo-dGDP phosphatase
MHLGPARPRCALLRLAQTRRTVVVVSEASAGRRRGFQTFGEQALYESPEVRLTRVDVGLPDGARVWRHVIHLHQAVSMVLLDDLDRVLLLWRHRFAQNRWGWELPGGLVEEDESVSEAVARELEDQTGYRAGETQHLITFQPFAGSVDGEHVVFAGHDVEQVGVAVSLDGIERVAWMALASVPELIAEGKVWNGGSLVGLQQALAQQ